MMIKKSFFFRKSAMITAVLYLFLFALIFYIIRCAPFLTDDYIFLARNTTLIKDAASESLHYGNGRFLGNFLSLFLVQHQFIIDIERALVLTLLIILLPRVLDEKDIRRRLLNVVVSSILLLGMSPLIFSEVFSWASGFHNYVPPVLLSVVCFLLVGYEEKNICYNIISSIFIFIFGVAAQLFLELSTIVNIFFTVFLICYYYFSKRKKLLKSIVWFISTLIGGIIMFIIPKVFKASELVNVDEYRKIHLGSFSDIISAVFDNTYQALYVLSKCDLIIVLLAILTFFALKKYKEFWKSQILFRICLIGSVFTAFFFLIKCVVNNYTVYTKFEMVSIFISIAAFLGFFIEYIIVIFHLPKSREKTRIVIFSIFSVFSVCPILIVSPFGNRCLFLSYIFIVLISISFLNLITKDESLEKMIQICKAAVLSLTALAVCLTIIFSDIYWLDIQQIAYIEHKMEEKPSEIEVLNFESDYIYTGRAWGYAYCYYNKEQFDVRFKDLSFEEWYKNRQAEGWYR